MQTTDAGGDSPRSSYRTRRSACGVARTRLWQQQCHNTCNTLPSTNAALNGLPSIVNARYLVNCAPLAWLCICTRFFFLCLLFACQSVAAARFHAAVVLDNQPHSRRLRLPPLLLRAPYDALHRAYTGDITASPLFSVLAQPLVCLIAIITATQ